jgi:serine/threonine-protein kinase RsbT
MVVAVTISTSLLDVLSDYVGTIVGRSIVECAASRCGVDPDSVTAGQVLRLTAALQSGIEAFVPDPLTQHECVQRLRAALEASCGNAGGDTAQLYVDILEEYDIVTVRNHARTLCNEVGFGVAEQVKVATVVSELARNIIQYAGQGRIELEAVSGSHPGIEIRAVDKGPGIDNLDSILGGSYSSKTGMGVGLRGTSKLMDDFHVESSPGRGTSVTVRKYLT